MNANRKKVGLAFQGGGFAGGALGTGVVTYLVEHHAFEHYHVRAFSGTSSGALVASVCWGYTLKRAMQQAPKVLYEQWTDLAYGSVPDAQTAEMIQLADSIAELNPLYRFWSSTVVAPHLRKMYRDWVLKYIPIDEFQRLYQAQKGKGVPELLIGATDILHARPKIFHEDDFSLAALLATGSLDDVIGITDIKEGQDKGQFIDGAWATNPPLTPLLDCDIEELWLVEVFPEHWEAAPRSPAESRSRRDELWQSALIHQELYHIHKVNQWIQRGLFQPGHKYRQIQIKRMHMNNPDLMIGSIFINNLSFLREMMDYGYRNAHVLIGGKPPASSPFEQKDTPQTPLSLFTRNANTLGRWCSAAMGN